MWMTLLLACPIVLASGTGLSRTVSGQREVVNDTWKNKSPSILLRYIDTYFSYRNIRDLNIYTCSLLDAMYLLRALTQINYKVNVKYEYMKPAVNVDTIEGNFMDLSCSKNQQSFLGIKEVEGMWLLWGEPRGRRLRLDSDVVAGGMERLWDLSEIRVPAGFPSSPRLPDRKLRYNLGGRILRGVFLNLVVNYDPDRKVEEVSDSEFQPNEEVDQRHNFVILSILGNVYNFRLKFVDGDTWGYLLKNGSFNGMIGTLARDEADLGVTPCEMREERFRWCLFLPPFQHIRLKFVDGDTWGYLLKNGSFNGMIGTLARDEADLGMTPCEMREERFRWCLFLPPFQHVRFVAFFLEERALGTYKALFVPFSSGVWLCTTGVVLFAGAVFRMIYKDDLSQGLVFVIGIIAQQGLAVDKNRLPFRILSTSLLGLGIILYSYYNAAIMNGLLSPSPVTIRDINDLIKSPIRVRIANVPYLNFSYNQQKYIQGKFLERIKSRVEWLLGVNEGLWKVRKEHNSLLVDDISIYPSVETTFTDNEKCSIRELEFVRPFPLSIPLKKNSPYREMLFIGIIQLLENGIAHREKKRWYPEKPHCLGTTIFTHVSLEAVSIALLCFLFGIVASGLIFIFEVIFFTVSIKK